MNRVLSIIAAAAAALACIAQPASAGTSNTVRAVIGSDHAWGSGFMDYTDDAVRDRKPASRLLEGEAAI